MIKIPLPIAKKLLLLQQGEKLAASSAKHAIIEELVEENILQRNGRVQKKLSVTQVDSLNTYLQNKFGINDLEKYVKMMNQDELLRSDLIESASNSKIKNVRTFKGFLVNCYEPMHAKLNENEIVIAPTAGLFQFIYDFETFEIPQNVTIVGVENPENFRHIEKQAYLFKDITPLFVCRYPQNQSKDLIKWLQSIPNPYLHFGDFDLAGIGIFLNEYKKQIGEKASYFIPSNIAELIDRYGNRELYDNQKITFDTAQINEKELLQLLTIIHRYKKGLEQEILCKTNAEYNFPPANSNRHQSNT